MGSFARLAANALSGFIGGADDVATKGSDDLVSTSMKKVDIDNTEEAKAMLGNTEQIDNWKKNNKVPKEEKNRRQTRKFSTEATALKEGDISGPEYRRYIKQNQPATEFAENDLDNMMSSFKEVVGALTVVIWARLDGGLFDLYAWVPGVIFAIIAIVVVSLLSKSKLNPVVVKQFDQMHSQV